MRAVLIVCCLVTTIGTAGCVTRDAVERARSDAAEAKEIAEAARSAADAAQRAAQEAQASADWTFDLYQRQSLPPGPLDRSDDRSVNMIVPNADYASDNGPYYRVWYGTNREPMSGSVQDGFSGEDGRLLRYGRALVYVPESHAFGQIGSSWIWRTVTMTDDRLKVTNMESLSRSEFEARLREQMQAKSSGKRSALVYIHGYATDFEEAIIRAAQIGFDLKVEGITALFSWPSAGSRFLYTSDEATVEASERYFEEFLRTIISNPTVESVNVLAHSMGNRALLRVAERLARDASIETKPINQIVLAAPDVDVRTFENLASHYQKISNRTTLYVSAEDSPLRLSGFMHQYQRVGIGPPVTVLPGIDTIAVDAIDVSLLGHSYFSSAEALLYDIFDLISQNADPVNRQRLRPATNQKGDQYWFFGK